MTGSARIGLIGGAVVIAAVAVTAAFRIADRDGAEPAPSSVPAVNPEAAKAAAPATEPEFKPGIPDLTMDDVREYKHLWREFEELQVWERSDRLSVAEFRSKAIEKMAHYLGVEGAAADDFDAAAGAAIAAIRTSFKTRGEAAGQPGGMEARFSADLAAATASLTGVLDQERPRHQLFEPDGKKWLLKLAFGPKEAKEARELRQASAGSAAAEGG